MMRKKSENAATSGLNGSDRKNPNAKRSEKREKVERIARECPIPYGPLVIMASWPAALDGGLVSIY